MGLAGTTYGSWKGDISGTDTTTVTTYAIAVVLDDDGQGVCRWQMGLPITALAFTL